MKREVPLLITFIIGLVMIIQFFVPHWPFSKLQQMFADWTNIIAIFALLLGILSLIKIHGEKISRKSEGWGYSIVLLLSFVITLIIGLTYGIGEKSRFDPTSRNPFHFIYLHLFNPLQATMFALLAFFVASAAYRAFRARTFEATLLLIAAFLVMLGRVPISDIVWHRFSDMSEWIMQVPGMAGQRAILIGAALGIVSNSLRIILGIEKEHLGRD